MRMSIRKRMRTIPKRKSNFPEYYNRIVLNQKAYIRSNICFFGGKMRRIWGYTLFWFAMGMLLMYIVGGGIIGILLIAGALLLSYLLYSCR